MSETFRTFLAIEFPEEIKDRIAKLLDSLRGIPEKIKWVEAHQVHLTIKFLGPTPWEKKNALSSALHQAMATIKPFDIVLEGVGAFPSLHRPHILWIGVQDGAPSLGALAQSVDAALDPLGFPPEERPYFAHATIGRIKGPVRPGTWEKAFAGHAQRARHFGQCHANVLTWIKSTLSAAGPVYEAIETIPFAKE